MLCPTCKNTLSAEDFFPNQSSCYKCVYKAKVDRLKELEPPEPGELLCRVCERKIPRGRKKYCCEECSYVEKIKKDRNRWHRKISAPSENFN